MNDYDWMEAATELAAQCWCDRETQHIDIDPALAKAVAQRIADWMATAAQYHRNTDYYRGLVVRCGEALGEEVYTQDDGGKVTDVLCAKVPELVERMAGPYNELLMQVSIKHPGETRHQTALRYLQQAERSDSGPAKSDGPHNQTPQ